MRVHCIEPGIAITAEGTAADSATVAGTALWLEPRSGHQPSAPLIFRDGLVLNTIGTYNVSCPLLALR